MEAVMQSFETFPNALYPISLGIAGICAFVIMVYMFVTSFTRKPEPGENTFTRPGVALLTVALAVGPIFIYEQIYPGVQFPRPGFALAWWIAFAVIVLIGIFIQFAEVIKKTGKIAWLLVLAYLLLATVSAAWVAKTVNVISHAFTISTLAGLGFGLLGLIYIILYGVVPFLFTSFALDKLGEYIKKSKATTTQATIAK
jgi:hypothetical protein